MHIYRCKNLIVSLLCVILFAGCSHVYDKPAYIKAPWHVYVWDFVSHHEKNDKLTTNLTNEFEAALISTKCCDVLERREYYNVIAHIKNEGFTMEGVSDTAKQNFKTIGANGVIFGKIYDEVENDEVKISMTLQSFDGRKIASEHIRLSGEKSKNSLHRELKMKELAKQLCRSLLDDVIVSRPTIIFQGIQNKHNDISMRGVEKRAEVLMEQALSKSELFEMIEKSSEKRLDMLRQEYPSLNYLVSGTITGDTHITEITLKFIDVRKKTIAKNLKAFNITTTYIDYIIKKLFLKVKDAFGASSGTPPSKLEEEKIPEKESIVIYAFQNNSGDKSLDYMTGNIAEGLITGLIRIEEYKVIERSQIKKLEEELKRTSSGLFDINTTVERGKLLAPQYIIVGSFQKENDNIRINARIDDLKTGENKCSDTVSGSETELTTLINKLANKFKSCL